MDQLLRNTASFFRNNRKSKIKYELPLTPPELAEGIFTLPPQKTPPQVLDIDKDTPDSHVARDSRLIRLTGVHPFNVEAPLSALFDDGFLTSPELFYVRNHGVVPNVHDAEVENWSVSVEGMVENPFTLTLKDLQKRFENVTYPVTLVCAGNRRKEQNVVKKSNGFSWGAAGVSTALFTGVAMADVIRLAKPSGMARYVCMEGADKLPNGYYGTSVKMNWVMDPNRGIMLAHKMNGEPLRPDHGKPLRVVIPGQIGGRSVKWLTKLIITDRPSDNWYHIYDNRVLPTMVSPEESAKTPSWWTDERYAIYDLSTNSAIAYPAHDEVIELPSSDRNDLTYTIKGYAYGGGGRRVTRVEFSLDQGRSWRLAQIDYAEDRYRDSAPGTWVWGSRLDVWGRETCFCWCFWKAEVGLSELAGGNTRDIVVRAMDESMNLQPKDMYWSVLGMMNNPWYRVVVRKENGRLRFEHPTQPAFIKGGWMERVKEEGGDLLDGFWGEGKRYEKQITGGQKKLEEEIKMTKDGLVKDITIQELKKNSSAEQPWFVLNGEVFDGTKFLNDHPGGAQSIVSVAGLDATDEFMAIHSETAKAMMPKYHIGSLNEASKQALRNPETQSSNSEEVHSIFLRSSVWKKTVLHSKEIVSHDSVILTFLLEHELQTLGLPIGQHVMIQLKDDKELAKDKLLIRSYTPISAPTRQGFFDVLVKIYRDLPSESGGRMSQALDRLPLGSSLQVKGPIGKFEYLGGGRCRVKGRERVVRRMVMICGGSGITPILQVARALVVDEDDHTRCTILDGNRTEEDILCRSELGELEKAAHSRCRVLHTLSNGGDGWEGRVGRIDEQLLSEEASCDGGDHGEAMAMVCGPKGMETNVRNILMRMSWREEDLLFF